MIRSLAVLLVLCSGLSAAHGEPTSLEPAEFHTDIAVRFARRFPREHLLRKSLDDCMAARAWTNYLAALDYNRVYFLDSDVKRFEKQKLELDDRLEEGDIAFAYEAFQLLRERVRNREAYVQKLLDDGFDFEKDETYRWRRKQADWPAAGEEWDDIWRRKIKNEYLQRVVQQELAAEQEAEQPDEAPEDGDPQKDPGDVKKELPAPVPETDPKPQADPEPETDPAPGTETELEDQAPVLSPEEYIRKRYRNVLALLDDSEAEFVLQRYLTAFAHAYDPHSGYMSASTTEDFDIEMKLSLVGIGALLRFEEGMATIVRVIPGGPADRDKSDTRLRPGDRIIAVGQGHEEPVDVVHWPLRKVVRLIRGERGTRVVLTCIPASDPGGTTTKTVDLERDEVRLEEQAADWRVRAIVGSDGVNRRLGILRVPAFYANMKSTSTNDPSYRSATYDVSKALVELQKEGIDGVVLDLRNNAGGSLVEAVRMTGLFFASGPTVQVKERYLVKVLSDRNKDTSYAGPLVVLVNRMSASASEILAGALQDYGRAVIVGDSKTHGKGSVQTILDLGRDRRLGTIKTTASMFYRITGASTQLRGVTPDIVVSSALDSMELGEDFLPNALEWTEVPRARYSRVSDLAAQVEELRRRSQERRAHDPRFEAFQALLDRLTELNRREVISLKLDQRLARARDERELRDLKDELSLDGDYDPSEDADDERDIVMAETLEILADLIDLKDPGPGAPAAARNDANVMNILLADWLKEIL